MKIPKNSYRYGYVDEGISDNLNKPKGFKYSDKFLKRWYEMKCQKKTKKEQEYLVTIQRVVTASSKKGAREEAIRLEEEDGACDSLTKIEIWKGGC